VTFNALSYPSLPWPCPFGGTMAAFNYPIRIATFSLPKFGWTYAFTVILAKGLLAK